MLIQKYPKTRLNVKVVVPAQTATLLKSIRKQAKALGVKINIGGAVAAFLVQEIHAAAKQLDRAALKRGADRTEGNHHADA